MTYWKKRFVKSKPSPKLIPLKVPDWSADRLVPVVATLPDGLRLEVPGEQAIELLPKLLSALKAES
ncbi:hypothetical protein [Motiliproteus sp. MSK22-1]|uniref:hypothetical protein n=1 Tax=Motiliproteus sp. MSK22-1 TaxID=1897630 RepID=UPI000975DCD2|nr:hypothetical protein [Motiliproteus sp. MSK22-1]OMH25156.1 hypothetical protein BGP75_26275 [Motiliproteus sp. MSK22-1]